MYNIQHRCMSLKVDVSRTTLIYVIFEFVLLRITIYLTKHLCIHVRNFVRKKKPYSRVCQLNPPTQKFGIVDNIFVHKFAAVNMCDS